MIVEHLEAVSEQIAPLDWARHIGAAPPSTLPPFVVITAPTWGDELEASLNPGDPFAVDVRITCSAATPEGALMMSEQVRATIAPARADAPLAVAGRHVRIRWERSEWVGYDNSVTLPEPNRHPGFAVDTYRITSQEVS